MSGDEVDVSASHSADRGTEAAAEVELPDGVADERFRGERHAAEVEVAPVGDDVVGRDVPEPGGHRVEEVPWPDDGHEVVAPDDLVARRDHGRRHRVRVLEPGDPDPPVVLRGEGRDGQGLVDLDAHGHVADLRPPGQGPRTPQGPGGGEQHHHDAAEVGDRVPDGRGGRVRRAGRGRREGRGVGQRTGIGAGHGVEAEAEEPAAEHGDPPEHGEAHRDEEQRRPPAAQRGEEVRAGDDADGVGEQDEAEGADDLGDLEVDPGRGGPGGDREGREEDGRGAEAYAEDTHVTDGGAERQQDGEEEHGGVGEEGEGRAHGSILPPRLPHPVGGR